MGNRLIVVSFILFSLAVAGEREDYSSLRESAWAQDPTTDFEALRFASVERPDYDPYFSVTPEYLGALVEVRDGDPGEAMRICESLSATHFVAIQMHAACADRLESLEQDSCAKRHRFMADGLLSSLVPDESGEVVIISAEEQYDFASSKRYKVTGHATVAPKEPGGQTRSVLMVVDETGRERWLYFIKHPAYRGFQANMIRQALDKVDK